MIIFLLNKHVETVIHAFMTSRNSFLSGISKTNHGLQLVQQSAARTVTQNTDTWACVFVSFVKRL